MKIKVFSEIQIEADDPELAAAFVKQTLRSAFSGSKPKTWTETTRNPRFSPRPGDVLEKKNKQREVINIDNETITYLAWKKPLPGKKATEDKCQKTCRLSSWFGWALESKVVP